MNTIVMICDMGFMNISCVSSLSVGTNIVTIYLAMGGEISLKRDSIEKLVFNGRELINQ